MCASPLPVSEVAATSAAVSRPTASHPRSAICVQDSSRRARVTGASALHIECMQMLQIIVYEDPIPTRLLLNHHSTRTAVPAWRYDSSRQAFSEASPAAGNLGVIAIPQIPPFALATCRALESEEATAIPPSALATCRALEEEEAMTKSRIT
jgi:hypothetical protein